MRRNVHATEAATNVGQTRIVCSARRKPNGTGESLAIPEFKCILLLFYTPRVLNSQNGNSAKPKICYFHWALDPWNVSNRAALQKQNAQSFNGKLVRRASFQSINNKHFFGEFFCVQPALELEWRIVKKTRAPFKLKDTTRVFHKWIDRIHKIRRYRHLDIPHATCPFRRRKFYFLVGPGPAATLEPRWSAFV